MATTGEVLKYMGPLKGNYAKGPNNLRSILSGKNTREDFLNSSGVCIIFGLPVKDGEYVHDENSEELMQVLIEFGVYDDALKNYISISTGAVEMSWEELFNDAGYVNTLVNNPSAMRSIMSSYNLIELATTTETFMNAFAGSQTAMQVFSANRTAVSLVQVSPYLDLITDNGLPVTRYFLALIGEDTGKYASLDQLLQSTEDLQKIAGNSNASFIFSASSLILNNAVRYESAMNIIVSNEAMMKEIADNETAMKTLLSTTLSLTATIGSLVAIAAIAANPTGSKVFAENEEAVTALYGNAGQTEIFFASTTGREAIANSPIAVGKISSYPAILALVTADDNMLETLFTNDIACKVLAQDAIFTTSIFGATISTSATITLGLKAITYPLFVTRILELSAVGILDNTTYRKNILDSYNTTRVIGENLVAIKKCWDTYSSEILQSRAIEGARGFMESYVFMFDYIMLDAQWVKLLYLLAGYSSSYKGRHQDMIASNPIILSYLLQTYNGQNAMYIGYSGSSLYQFYGCLAIDKYDLMLNTMRNNPDYFEIEDTMNEGEIPIAEPSSANRNAYSLSWQESPTGKFRTNTESVTSNYDNSNGPEKLINNGTLVLPIACAIFIEKIKRVNTGSPYLWALCHYNTNGPAASYVYAFKQLKIYYSGSGGVSDYATLSSNKMVITTGVYGSANRDNSGYYFTSLRGYRAWVKLPTVSYTFHIDTNQDDKSVLSDVIATISSRYVNKQIMSGETVNLPVGFPVTVSFTGIEGYKTPELEPFSPAYGQGNTIKDCIYESEITIVNVSSDDDSLQLADTTITIKNASGVLLAEVQGTEMEVNIPYDTEYTVSVNDILLYENLPQTYVANQSSRVIQMIYEKVTPDYIIVDMTKEDPDEIITGDINGYNVRWIRANSHRYLCKRTGEVELTICQMLDTDSRKYYDGTVSELLASDGDMGMRLPIFHHKAEEIATDIWKVGFSIVKIDDTWQTYENNEVIGVFKANSAMRSLYNVSAIGYNYSWNEMKDIVAGRGKGYSLIKLRHNNILTFLGYALYGTTNLQNIIGSGNSSFGNVTTGISVEKGMADTVYGEFTGGRLNFWGLEDFWGTPMEAYDNVEVATNYVLNVTEDDGTVRSIQAPTKNGFISKLNIGKHLDTIAKDVNSSLGISKGFCGYSDSPSIKDNICVRASFSNSYKGITLLYSLAKNYLSTSYYSSYYGTRIAFKGNIIEEKDVQAFKALPFS